MNDFDPEPGVAETLAPGLRRVLAPNPSPMTYRGTNTYLLGQDAVVVVDPGPDDDGHLAALMTAIGEARVSHIVVTHSHLDHSPLAQRLSAATGAPVGAFGPSDVGRSAVMRRLIADGYTGGGEGVDADFVPDIRVADGEIFETPAGPLHVLHTPGHMGNHICLRWGEAVFSGDLVMGWATSLVSPPDGDVSDFIASCRRLRGWGGDTLYPGHGAPVVDPMARIDWLIAHRLARRAEVLAALSGNAATIPQITATVYADVPESLWPIAARNVFATLIELVETGEAAATPELSPDAQFARRPD